MKIATILSTHTDPELTLDTLDSILCYMTEDVLLFIDGVCKDFDDISLPVYKMKGFRHGCPSSPYRNVALALKSARSTFPDADWYCYMEYDCLVASDRFKKNLKLAQERGVWMMGCDGRIDSQIPPFISEIVRQPITSSYYLLGACQFFSSRFLEELEKYDFFDAFLTITSSYTDGFIPFYQGYDVSEHVYPTLARRLGGNIGVFSSWDAEEGRWHGSSDIFPIRWKPEIDEASESATIIHPLKSLDHPIRRKQREIRNEFKTKKYSCSS